MGLGHGHSKSMWRGWTLIGYLGHPLSLGMTPPLCLGVVIPPRGLALLASLLPLSECRYIFKERFGWMRNKVTEVLVQLTTGILVQTKCLPWASFYEGLFIGIYIYQILEPCLRAST